MIEGRWWLTHFIPDFQRNAFVEVIIDPSTCAQELHEQSHHLHPRKASELNQVSIQDFTDCSHEAGNCSQAMGPRTLYTLGNPQKIPCPDHQGQTTKFPQIRTTYLHGYSICKPKGCMHNGPQGLMLLVSPRLRFTECVTVPY